MKKIAPLFLVILLVAACENAPYKHVELKHPDGTPQVVKYYKTMEMEILLKKEEYHENGQKRLEGSFKDGKRHGEWTAWYDDGTPWSRGYYKQGIENGLKTVWHKNGQKYYEGPIVDDQRAGTWKFWNEEGELIKEVNYGSGK